MADRYGQLGSRYQANVAYLIDLHDNNRHLHTWSMLEPWRARHRGDAWRGTRPWDAEYAGKWLDAAALMAAGTGHQGLRCRLETFASAMRDLQAPDGYMGIEQKPPSNWDVWNQWYAITGWLTHDEQFGSPGSRHAAIRCADWITARFDPPQDSGFFRAAWGGGCNVDVVGQMVRVAQITGERKYLDFVKQVASAYPPINQMRATGRPHLTHAYVLCAYLGGLTRWAVAVDNVEELAWIERVWEAIRHHHQYPTGSIGRGEKLHEPPLADDPRIQETCATVEWLLWTARLYEATGNPRYIDAMERTAYNALLGAQSADGTKWTYFAPLHGRKAWFEGPTECCFWSGPRGLARLPLWIYATDSNGIRVDLFEASKATLLVQGESVTVEQSTSYPADGRTTVRLALKKPLTFSVRLRMPAWTVDATVEVNGERVETDISPGSHCRLDRTWSGGDVVVFRFAMASRFEAFTGIGAALVRGPEVLALDSRDNPGLDLDAVRISSCSEPDLRPLPPEGSHRRRYEATVDVGGAARKMVFTPFADSGAAGAAFRAVFPPR